ncbi:hypothetical protein BKA62DRAFT_721366 [Auriculariales sp. MPI-PUGE-AT-0066]|nr:hypothetical protein BKA62DRAFT_721366 [Auriculariales sp. MPI-PUGE-AT-0066]
MPLYLSSLLPPSPRSPRLCSIRNTIKLKACEDSCGGSTVFSLFSFRDVSFAVVQVVGACFYISAHSDWALSAFSAFVGFEGFICIDIGLTYSQQQVTQHRSPRCICGLYKTRGCCATQSAVGCAYVCRARTSPASAPHMYPDNSYNNLFLTVCVCASATCPWCAEL